MRSDAVAFICLNCDVTNELQITLALSIDYDPCAKKNIKDLSSLNSFLRSVDMFSSMSLYPMMSTAPRIYFVTAARD